MAIQCASCGQDNREGARFCLRCGSALSVEPGADPLIGRVLHERYRVRRVVGEGGMGRVYLGEQQMGPASRDVAIKVLHEKHSRDETLRQRFYGECEVVVGLTHPHTIQFHDFGALEDGRLFIVMEYIEGHSLAEALLAGPMPLPRVERLVSQIAGSLQEAHERGVIHRDLKPDNVLLTVRGGEADFVKVCDFGIAKRPAEGELAEGPALTLQGTVIGTPQYMSPEQLAGGDIDARSDVYSLGLMVYEMLAGRRPFEASSAIEWAAKHTASAPPPLSSHAPASGLPPHVIQVVMQALEKDREKRPASMRAFASALLGRADATTPITMDGRASVSAPGAPASVPPVDQHAPTMLSPATPMTGPEVLKPAGVRASLAPLFIGAVIFAVGLAGAGWLLRDRLFGAEETPDAGVPALDAGGDAGPPDAGPRTPREWTHIVHFQRRVDDAALALGPPDGRYAVVRPQGTLVLEIEAGTRIASDGTSQPDVRIEIDDARSDPYRADVGVARNQYTTVGSELVGSLGLDADQFEISRIRYVRIKNRGRRNLYVDAVGAYDTVAAED
ncbi:MAG: serine/threonine-protein kinase [Myxococcota bacterium]|nr:serine/threonine-protein kinase [Myxococcota bacterium]